MAAAYSIGRDVPLAARNTFGLDVRARAFATIHDAAALPALLAEPSLQGQPQMVLGAGSNVLFADSRYDGCLLHLVCNSTHILRNEGDRAVV
ncbi:MAG: UDP-N-acetylmuramate dehydrogenase, partial [Steroidobacteraceae bacterium]